MQASQFRLLAIDGGGIRGLIPAMILEYIERQTGRPIFELFDAVAGTSTGGIIALALTRPDARLGSAADLVQLYLNDGGSIFRERLIDKLLTLPGFLSRWLEKRGLPQGFDVNDLFSPRYQPAGREAVFRRVFGDATLSEARLPVFIPSYDTELRCPVFFVSRPDQIADDEYYDAVADASMLDAAMATSAAPTYFPPHKITRANGYYSLVDGGVFANNPTGLAHSFLRGAHYEGDVVLSLGTGSMQDSYGFDELKGWGALNWASPVLRMTFDGQAEATSVALRRRLSSASYLRIQSYLRDPGATARAQATDDLDDYSPRNLEAVQALAGALIDQHARTLDAWFKLLTS